MRIIHRANSDNLERNIPEINFEKLIQAPNTLQAAMSPSGEHIGCSYTLVPIKNPSNDNELLMVIKKFSKMEIRDIIEE